MPKKNEEVVDVYVGGDEDAQYDELDPDPSARGDFVEGSDLPPPDPEPESETENAAEQPADSADTDAETEAEPEAQSSDSVSEDSSETEAAESESTDKHQAAAESAESGEEPDAADNADDGESADSQAPAAIPKARFDQVNERRKAAERRVAELEAQTTASEQAEENTYDFDAKEREYAELTLDGNIDGALALRKEIRAAERALYRKEAEQLAQESFQTQSAQLSVQEMADEYTRDFAEFDPDSEQFNDLLVDDVLAQYQGYVAGGKMTRAQAFKRASDNVVKLNDLKNRNAPPEPAPSKKDIDPPPTPPPAPPKKPAVSEKVHAANAQAPDLSQAGQSGASHGAAAVDIDQLTDEELEALPEHTLARLRGDVM